MVACVSAVAATQHNDTRDYLQRLVVDSGSLASGVQIELNEFVKWHYKAGIRANTGTNHTIKLCGVFISTNINGYLNCLWHTSTTKKMLLNSGTVPTYSQNLGLAIDPTLQKISLDFNSSNLSSNNYSLGIYNLVYTPTEDYFGGQDAANFLTRLQIHYPWSNGSVYFDSGNETSGRVFASHPGTPGLTMGVADSQLYITHNGSVLATKTKPSLSNPNVNFLLQGTDEVNPPSRPRKIGGFLVGNNISSSLMADLYSAWNRLQKAVSSSRP
jgi:hypothetical protein